MKHDPNLALQLLVADLSIKVAKLTARLARAEGRIDRFRRKSRAKPQPVEARPKWERDETEVFARAAEICAPVAEAAGLTLADLLARDRRDYVVRVRQDAMLACHQAGISTPIIGRFLDGRDHTTILHGIGAAKARKIAANQAAKSCASGPFVQDSERDGECCKHSTAPDQHGTVGGFAHVG